MIENLTVVNVDGNVYLCDVINTKGKTELHNASPWDYPPKKNIIEWIKRHNLGELSTIHLSNKTGYTIDPLTIKQKRLLKRLWEDMQEIKMVAISRLENTYFMKDIEDEE